MKNTIKTIPKLELIVSLFLIFVIISNPLASEITWVGDNQYRIILTTGESNPKYATLPLSYDLDQDDIKSRYKINLDQIDLDIQNWIDVDSPEISDEFIDDCNPNFQRGFNIVITDEGNFQFGLKEIEVLESENVIISQVDQLPDQVPD